MSCTCPKCERRANYKFVKALQAQGHSFSDVFSIILDMEFHNNSRREWLISQAVRQGTIDGYLYFERDISGDWHVLLTELGHQRSWDLDSL